MKIINGPPPIDYHIIEGIQHPTSIIVLRSSPMRENPTPLNKQLGFVIVGLIISTLNIFGQVICLSICAQTFDESYSQLFTILLIVSNIWAVGNGILTWVTAVEINAFIQTKYYLMIVSIITGAIWVGVLIYALYQVYLSQIGGWDGLYYILLAGGAALDLLLQEGNYILALFFYISIPNQYYHNY